MGNLRYVLWPWRWLRSASELARGSRVHPTAQLMGNGRRIQLDRGTVIGARTRLMPRGTGLVATEAGVWLAADVEIQTDTEVRIGAGTTIQRGCMFHGSVRIGRECLLAPNVYISSGTHPFRAYPHLGIREQERLLRVSGDCADRLDRPVCIQDDCWVGVNAVISRGVTLGKGSVVGANAVVCHDVPPYSVAVGIPARVASRRLNWSPPDRIDGGCAEDLVYVLSGLAAGNRDARRRSIVISQGEPLIAAVTPAARAIRVHYRASGNVQLDAAGSRFTVAEGPGFIDVMAAGMRVENGAILFRLDAIGATRSSSLEVVLLEKVE